MTLSMMQQLNQVQDSCENLSEENLRTVRICRKTNLRENSLVALAIQTALLLEG